MNRLDPCLIGGEKFNVRMESLMFQRINLCVANIYVFSYTYASIYKFMSRVIKDFVDTSNVYVAESNEIFKNTMIF